MGRLTKPAKALAGVGIIGILLSGCAVQPAADAPGKVTDTIQAAWQTDPTTFDPALISAMDDYRAARLQFDTVVRYDLDGSIIGGLAESWEESPTEVTLNIASGAVCGDGEAITPTVVADSIARLASPETKANMAGLIFGGNDVKVTADDAAGTVKIELATAYSELLAGLTVPAAGIVCPAGLKNLDGLAKGTVPEAFTGPYGLTKATTGVGYDFTLRDDYKSWPKYSTPLDGEVAKALSFSVGVDSTTSGNQLLTGDLQASVIPAQGLARFDGNDDFETIDVNMGEMFVIFNESETSPFSDPKMRLAAAQVLDREAFRDIVGPTSELLASPAVSSAPCANTDESLLVKQDLEAAKKVLDGVKIRVIGTNGIGTNGAGNVYVQERLLAAGAEIELANIDNGAWITRILGPETDTWDLTIFGSINNVGTLVTSLSRFLGTPTDVGGRNIARATNPEGEAAYAAALATVDPVEKCAAYQEAQASVLDRVDIVPFMASSLHWVLTDDVTMLAPAEREDLTTLRIVK